MNNEKESFIDFIKFGAGVALGLTIIVGGFLWYVGYMMDQTEQELHNDIASNFYVGKEYHLEVQTDFISGNECLFWFTAYLYNKSSDELISQYDGYYDVCDGRLLDNNLKVIKGKITWS